eukprot:CAMPEP_0172910684 /NCGR_PEP_ID=MMETSP1075-20121228/185118_1 /TAXON_ID=2916 /ORGANISM="Ceratium fusus, Strain PA161109" /LENGTH=294 /DNA_ID=CAMNT_0013768859 /DNA_START=51 /DNA_END=932 /DNA_ORIENTATION=+
MATSFSDVVQGQSARVLRAASSTLSGGHASTRGSDAVERTGDGGQAATEATPLRRSRRVGIQEQMEQRGQEEFQDLLLRRRFLVVFVVVVLLVLSAIILMLILFVNAVHAFFVYGDKPCDQPLRLYMIATLGSHILHRVLSVCTQGMAQSHTAKFLLGVLLSVPGSLVVLWGLYMVYSSKTCWDTNPGLFYATRNYIIMQVVCVPCFLLLLLASALGLRRLVPLLSRLRQSPGCQAAVQRLPRVDPSAPELLNTEEGTSIDCPICMEPLSSFRPDASVVRCPCSHHFHLECLAT